MAEYAHPEILVTTDWVEQHKGDAHVRLVEVDVDTQAYQKGHIQGAAGLSWDTQLCDQVRRDLVSMADWENLLGGIGVSNDTAVVAYGDNNNWFAAWFLWQMKYHGHEDVRLMDGGRKKWELEKRPLTTEVPNYPRGNYKAKDPDQSIRAYLSQVWEAMEKGAAEMVDVRSPQEYTGEILSPPGLNETCQRGGHIPGAQNIPWSQAVKEDGSFKSFDELKKLYGGKGISGSKEVIAYCRIGERSSHTWVVLKYLLGFDKVRNYDGSWTEWGNLVGIPVAKGPKPE